MLYLENNTCAPLTESESELIVNYYNRKFLSSAENEDIEKVLSRLYQDEHANLLCGCMKISICNGKNRFYIRCDTQHKKSCELNNREKIFVPPKGPRNPPKDPIVDLLPTGGERKPGQSDQTGGGGQGGNGKNSKVIATMLNLLYKAETYKIFAPKRSYEQTNKNLIEAAKQIHIPCEKTLNDILHIGSLDFELLKERLEQKPESWPKGSTWHQVVLLSCDKYEDVKVEKKRALKIYSFNTKTGKYNKPLTIKIHDSNLRINTPGNFSKSSNGPFLFMFVFSLKEARDYRFVTPVKIGAMYINSRSELCPLESQYERGMLWALLAELPANGANWSIEKPIYDENDVRPDFKVLTSFGTSIAIEVAGMKTPEYKESKSITHERMKQLFGGRLYEFDAASCCNEFADSLHWLKKEEILDQ